MDPDRRAQAEAARLAADRQHHTERLKLTVEIWKKTVDVQQHFNDLELRIRNFALTLLVGILGGTAFAIQQGYYVNLVGFHLSLAALLLSAGFVAWCGFYLLDRHWYHRLLLGSVAHGMAIEDRYAETLPELALAHAITAASHVEMRTWKLKIGYHFIATAIMAALTLVPVWAFRPDLRSRRLVAMIVAGAFVAVVVARLILLPDWKIRARHRIDLFYGAIAFMLLVLIWAANTATKT